MPTNQYRSDGFYAIRSPANYYHDMRVDIEVLYRNERYSTCTMIILCCTDALGAGEGEATSGKFAAFAEKELPDLCAALACAQPGKTGAQVLYDKFRNGFSHRRGPKAAFAIARDHELAGDWAGELPVDGRRLFWAVNVDRLVKEFLAVVQRLESTPSAPSQRPASPS